MNRIKDYLKENISITSELEIVQGFIQYELQGTIKFYKKYYKACGIINEKRNKLYKFRFSNNKYFPITDFHLFLSIKFVNINYNFDKFTAYKEEKKDYMGFSKYKL